MSSHGQLRYDINSAGNEVIRSSFLVAALLVSGMPFFGLCIQFAPIIFVGFGLLTSVHCSSYSAVNEVIRSSFAVAALLVTGASPSGYAYWLPPLYYILISWVATFCATLVLTARGMK